MSSATDNLGPHLLGWTPPKPDPRDYALSAFLTSDSLDEALAELKTSRWVSKSVKNWASVITARVKTLSPAPAPTPVPPAPAPAPDPTPIPVDPTPTPVPVDPTPVPVPIPAPTPTPSVQSIWVDNEAPLDQKQTCHCVGYGCAQFGNTNPFDDHWVNAVGDAIYYEAKIWDGEQGQENGSSVRSGLKSLKARGRILAYAKAASTDEITAWLKGHGPVLVGTEWTRDMFTPDGNGYIIPTGQVDGGHCYLIVGYLADEDAYLVLNSWGSAWGLAGYFKIKVSDFAILLAGIQNAGEAWAAAELPL